MVAVEAGNARFHISLIDESGSEAFPMARNLNPPTPTAIATSSSFSSSFEAPSCGSSRHLHGVDMSPSFNG